MLNLYIVMLTYARAMVNTFLKECSHRPFVSLIQNIFVGKNHQWFNMNYFIFEETKKNSSNWKLKMKLLSWIKQNIIKEKETLASKCMQQGTSPQARKCWIISLSGGLHLYPLVLIYALVLIFASALMHTTSGRIMAEPGIHLIHIIYQYTLHPWFTHFVLHLFFLTFF